MLKTFMGSYLTFIFTIIANYADRWCPDDSSNVISPNVILPNVNPLNRAARNRMKLELPFGELTFSEMTMSRQMGLVRNGYFRMRTLCQGHSMEARHLVKGFGEGAVLYLPEIAMVKIKSPTCSIEPSNYRTLRLSNPWIVDTLPYWSDTKHNHTSMPTILNYTPAVDVKILMS